MTRKRWWIGRFGCLLLLAFVVLIGIWAMKSIPMFTKPMVLEKTDITMDAFRSEYETFPKDIQATSVSFYRYSHFQALTFAAKISYSGSGIQGMAEKVASWVTNNKGVIKWAKAKTVNQMGLKLPSWMEEEKFDGVYETSFISIWYSQEQGAIYVLQTD